MKYFHNLATSIDLCNKYSKELDQLTDFVLQLEVSGLETLKNLIWIILFPNFQQALPILRTISRKHVLCAICVILVDKTVMKTHFFRKSYRSCKNTGCRMLDSIIISSVIPADCVVDHLWEALGKTPLEGRGYSQSNGPSSSEIPRAFPPFLWNVFICFLVIICIIRLGRRPLTCFIALTSKT